MMKKLWSLLLIISLVTSIVGCVPKTEESIVDSSETTIQDNESPNIKEDESKELVSSEEVVMEENTDTVDKNDMTDQVELLYKDFIIANDENSVTYMDKFGKETKVTKNPKRVVIAYNSILGLWYFAGGTSLTKVKGTTNVPAEAMELTDLGSLSELSLEAIVAQEPDLVILTANYESQVALAPILNEMGIETMIVDVSVHSYERFKENAYLFSLINKTQNLYEERIMPINTAVDDIIQKAKTSETSPKVAAIFATSKSISLESDLAMVGEMVSILGGANVVDEDVVPKGETRIAFSLEALVTQNPEIIMISTMGSVDGVKENMEKMIAENPVWNEVDAVKNDRVYYLPKEYSVYKANELYADAFTMVAKILYPEIFGE